MTRAFSAVLLLALGCSSSAGSDNAAPAGAAGSSGAASSGGALGTAEGGGSGGAGDSGAGGVSGGGVPAAGGARAAGGTGAEIGGAGSGGTPSSAKAGQVAFTEYLSPFHQFLQASFTSGQSAAAATHCDTLTAGTCSASICDPATSTPETSAPSAGTITFTSTDITGAATVSPNQSGIYGAATLQFQSPFGGGEHGVFKATGADVPAFEQEVDAPLLLLLSAPAVSGPMTLVSRAADLSLQWTRGVPEVSLLVVGSSDRPDGQPGTASLYCAFASEQGAGSIPTAMLQRMKQGASLIAVTAHEKVIQAGDYRVTLAFESDLRNANNMASVDFLLN